MSVVRVAPETKKKPVFVSTARKHFSAFYFFALFLFLLFFLVITERFSMPAQKCRFPESCFRKDVGNENLRVIEFRFMFLMHPVFFLFCLSRLEKTF